MSALAKRLARLTVAGYNASLPSSLLGGGGETPAAPMAFASIADTPVEDDATVEEAPVVVVHPGDVIDAVDGALYEADPNDAWSAGESAIIGDEEQHWTGDDWAAGPSPDNEG